jgi:hypothetical protein
MVHQRAAERNRQGERAQEREGSSEPNDRRERGSRVMDAVHISVAVCLVHAVDFAPHPRRALAIVESTDLRQNKPISIILRVWHRDCSTRSRALPKVQRALPQ